VQAARVGTGRGAREHATGERANSQALSGRVLPRGRSPGEARVG
jgi:hypothetical protein